MYILWNLVPGYIPWTHPLSITYFELTVVMTPEYTEIGNLPYPIIIFGVDVSSFVNKKIHCGIIATFNCNVQWSFLTERNND